jgi:acetolactate synthase-1/2/3 large subunit
MEFEKMKAASIVVDTLANLGITHCAGVIGSSVEDIIDAFNDDGRLRYISVRHEQVAASICDGYAKVVRRPMACLAHAGPGACNLMIGVASAFRDSTPMLVLTGNSGSSRLGRDAWHELDVSSLFAPITKWTTRVKRTSELASVIRRAHSLAIEGRPGPVHIDIPQDITATDLPALDQSNQGQRTPLHLGKLAVERSIAAKVLERILSAKRPLLIAGSGTIWSGAWDALEAFASALCLPVVTTESARGVLS